MRVLIVASHVLIREFLRLMLTGAPDLDVAAVAQDGPGVLRFWRGHTPDVVIVDMSVGCEKGLGAIQQIRRRRAGAGIVVVSVSFDEGWIAQALQIGAHGFVAERDVREELGSAVRAVHHGDSYFSASISKLASQAVQSELLALPELSL